LGVYAGQVPRHSAKLDWDTTRRPVPVTRGARNT
jgi:hypothetical protein